jgi:uncharacterized protein
VSTSIIQSETKSLHRARGGTADGLRRSPAHARSAGFRRFAARRPIAAFLIMVFSIGYPVMFLVALAAHQVIPGEPLIERLPIHVDELSGLLLTMFALLPSAIYVTWAAEGRAGVRKLFRRVTRWRFGLRWWIFILAALPVLTVVSGLLLGDTLRPAAPAHLVLDQVRLLLINLLLVNLWEETAWAGVLQTRLERRHNVFVAAGLAAVPFGLMHWPLTFLGEFTTTSALIALPAYILLGAFVRPLAGLIMRGAGDSVLAFALLHSVFNRSFNPDGIGATFLNGGSYQLGILIVLVLLTISLALLQRHKLGPSYRHHLDSDPARPPRLGDHHKDMR